VIIDVYHLYSNIQLYLPVEAIANVLLSFAFYCSFILHIIHFVVFTDALSIYIFLLFV